MSAIIELVSGPTASPAGRLERGGLYSLLAKKSAKKINGHPHTLVCGVTAIDLGARACTESD